LLETRSVHPDPSNTGRVDVLVRGGSYDLSLVYWDRNGVRRQINSSTSIGDWEQFTLSLAETVGRTSGTLRLSVNGKPIATVGHADVGGAPVDYFAVGDVESPVTPKIHGNITFSNVVATTDELARMPDGFSPPPFSKPAERRDTPRISCLWKWGAYPGTRL
jgi:hypothetical protein